MSETFGAAEMRELADEQGWQLANVSLPVVAEQVQRRYDDVPLDDVRAALADARAGEPSQQSASDEAPGDAPPQDERAQDGAERAASERWREVRTDAIQPGQYPPERHEEQRWMGRKDKLPFAPWGDRDAALECSHRTFATHSDDDPGEVVEECEDCQAHRDGTTTAECDHDARYKWGNEAHYITGERMDMAEDDPRLDGRVYIQADDSPPAFVDGDDVRCPETGEVHPEFLELLDRIGFTYGDVSVSDSGLHAVYNGELPGTSGQAVFDIDEEPWGANDEPPTVEIYTTKHVCVMTGRHLVDTPLEVRDWNRGALRNILEEYDALDDGNQQPEPDHDTDRELDLGDYSPTATARGESTDDVRDIVRAVDRLDASDLRLRTQQVSRDGTGWEQWDPSTYRTSSGGDSLHSPPDEPVFHDFKHGQSFGVLSLYAAEQGIIRYPWDTLAGDDWWAAVEAAREDGAPIPEYESSEPEPVSALPIPRLRSLDRDAAKRFARKRGHDWPSTKEAQRRLKNRTLQAMRVGERVIVDAPTALGKSYTVSTHYWSEENEDITGGSPVIQFHETREARDQAFRETEEHGGHGIRMLGRTEACPCAAGDHDPATEDGEEDPEQVVTVDGTPASIVLQRLCEGKGLPFSVAHTLLRKHQEQQRDDLPCEEGEGVECRAIAQWHGVPRTEEGEPAADVIHATHQFAHVPSLRKGTNMVFDERPDFQQDDLSQDRIRRAVTAFLKEVDAEVHDYEHLLTVSRNGLAPNEHDPADLAERWERLHEDLSTQPSRDWYLEHEDAHTLAPALARAILQADEEANGRRSATVPHEPPRLDAEADDDDGWNRVWVTIVLDEDNNIRTVRSAPSMSTARSVIGLDAHPTQTLWQRNTDPNMVADRVLDSEERRLWRLFERGLTVVQVGEATRPVTTGEYFDDRGARVLLEHLREEYGDDFRTAITSAAVEDDLAELLEAAGVDDPETMHYGEEKSRDDFGDEEIGYLEGCIDPGDDMVLDLLAEAGLHAEPETAVNSDGEEYRAHGRGFVGPDAAEAAALLASVREQHVAQAAGRYARNARDADDTATVFVRTSALPPGFADLKVPGVDWRTTEKQAEVLRALRDQPTATARELAETAGVTKEHVRETLARAVETDVVERREAAGDHGADVYRALTGLERVATGAADLSLDQAETTNDPTMGPYTWSLAIVSPHVPLLDDDSGDRDAFAPPEVATDDRQAGISDFDPA